MMTDLIAFQSVVGSPSNKQIDSKASFTGAGGLAMDRTSTKCCFFMDFTADYRANIKIQFNKGNKVKFNKENKIK